MFSALIKAFTGRAGSLASILALLIVAVIAFAVVTGTPRVQQKLLADTQTPSPAMQLEADTDDQISVDQATAEVRADNQAENSTIPLPASVGSNEVTESVDAEIAPDNAGQGDDSAPTADTDVQDSTQTSEDDAAVASSDTESGQVLATNPSAEADTTKQSSLALRYDGLKLVLSGHLADDQLAQLITEEVRNAIPLDSELTAEVDGNGGASPLNWMGQFLAVVARLPDDAQGLITGSDLDGVQIIPDAEQKLVMAPLDDSGNIQSLDENDKATELESDDSGSEPLMDTAQDSANEQADMAGDIDPTEFILDLNTRMATQPMFATGDIEISPPLIEALDQLAKMLQAYPTLFLRIVGNLDFGVKPQDAEYVGEDRARQVRDYLRAQGIEASRVFTAPLPRDYAFDKRVQLVFYISE